MSEITCFTIGIIKGLRENDDAYRHFGSILCFKHHLGVAIELSLATDDGKLTKKGATLYDVAELSRAPDTRAYMWSKSFVKSAHDWMTRQGMEE